MFSSTTFALVNAHSDFHDAHENTAKVNGGVSQVLIMASNFTRTDLEKALRLLVSPWKG